MDRHPFSNYTPATRGRIVGLVEAGYTQQQIVNIVGCNINTVKLWSSQYRRNGINGLLDHRKNNKRPRITTNEEERDILMTAMQNPFESAKNILNIARVDISVHTACRRLKQQGLVSRPPLKKPALTQQHREARLQYARDHVDWTQQQWDCVVLSDEKVIIQLK